MVGLWLGDRSIVFGGVIVSVLSNSVSVVATVLFSFLRLRVENDTSSQNTERMDSKVFAGAV